MGCQFCFRALSCFPRMFSNQEGLEGSLLVTSPPTSEACDIMIEAEKSLWCFSANTWPRVADYFGFDTCGKYHRDERVSYNPTTCDVYRQTFSWEGFFKHGLPRYLKCRYKAKFICSANHKTRGSQKKTLPVCPLHKLPLSNGQNRLPCTGKNVIIEDKEDSSFKRDIPVPCSCPNPKSGQHEVSILAYSVRLIVINVSKNPSFYSDLHALDLHTQEYKGNLYTDNLREGFLHCTISHDSSLIAIGSLGKRRHVFDIYEYYLAWYIFRNTDKTVERLECFKDHRGFWRWKPYGELSFNPCEPNSFVIAGTCIYSDANDHLHEDFAVCSFKAEDRSVSLITKIIQPNGIKSIQHLSHSPDGELCIMVEEKSRSVHILSAHTLETLKIITEDYVSTQLHRKTQFYSHHIHMKVETVQYFPSFSVNRYLSGCNTVPVSRGSAFICISTVKPSDTTVRDQVVVMRLPVLRVRALLELSKRQILQCIPHGQKERLSLEVPKSLMDYIFK